MEEKGDGTPDDILKWGFGSGAIATAVLAAFAGTAAATIAAPAVGGAAILAGTIYTFRVIRRRRKHGHN